MQDFQNVNIANNKGMYNAHHQSINQSIHWSINHWFIQREYFRNARQQQAIRRM